MWNVIGNQKQKALIKQLKEGTETATLLRRIEENTDLWTACWRNTNTVQNTVTLFNYTLNGLYCKTCLLENQRKVKIGEINIGSIHIPKEHENNAHTYVVEQTERDKFEPLEMFVGETRKSKIEHEGDEIVCEYGHVQEERPITLGVGDKRETNYVGDYRKKKLPNKPGVTIDILLQVSKPITAKRGLTKKDIETMRQKIGSKGSDLESNEARKALAVIFMAEKVAKSKLRKKR